MTIPAGLVAADARVFLPGVEPATDKDSGSQALSAYELAGMRTDVTAHLPDRADILRRVDVLDGMGSVEHAWQSMGLVQCRLGPYAMGSSSEREDVAPASLLAKSSWTLTVPNGTDIRVTDRVSCNGETFEVVHADDAIRSWSILQTIRLSRLQ